MTCCGILRYTSGASPVQAHLGQAATQPGQVPDERVGDKAGHGQQLAVAAERQTANLDRAAPQSHATLECLAVVEYNRPLLRTRGQRLAVRTEGDCPDRGVVSLEQAVRRPAQRRPPVALPPPAPAAPAR